MIALHVLVSAALACLCGDEDGVYLTPANRSIVPANVVFHVFYEGDELGPEATDVQLFDSAGNPVPVSVTAFGEARNAAVTPLAPLKPGRDYQLVVWPTFGRAPHGVQVHVGRRSDRVTPAAPELVGVMEGHAGGRCTPASVTVPLSPPESGAVYAVWTSRSATAPIDYSLPPAKLARPLDVGVVLGDGLCRYDGLDVDWLRRVGIIAIDEAGNRSPPLEVTLPARARGDGSRSP